MFFSEIKEKLQTALKCAEQMEQMQDEKSIQEQIESLEVFNTDFVGAVSERVEEEIEQLNKEL